MSASPQSANLMMGGQWRELQGPPINNFLEVIPKTLFQGHDVIQKNKTLTFKSIKLETTASCSIQAKSWPLFLF